MLYLTDADLDKIYEDSKVGVIPVGSEIRQLVGEIREYRRRPSVTEVHNTMLSLKNLSDWLIANDHDMKLPEGIDDPLLAAALLRRLAVHAGVLPYTVTTASEASSDPSAPPAATPA